MFLFSDIDTCPSRSSFFHNSYQFSSTTGASLALLFLKQTKVLTFYEYRATSKLSDGFSVNNLVEQSLCCDLQFQFTVSHYFVQYYRYFPPTVLPLRFAFPIKQFLIKFSSKRVLQKIFSPTCRLPFGLASSPGFRWNTGFTFFLALAERLCRFQLLPRMTETFVGLLRLKNFPVLIAMPDWC